MSVQAQTHSASVAIRRSFTHMLDEQELHLAERCRSFAMGKQKNLHIVALPVPGEGHVSPMMHLCGHLAKHGFSITFVAVTGGFSMYDKIKQKGAWPPPGLDITLKELKNDIPYPADAVTEKKLNLTAVHLHARTYQDRFEEIVADIEDVSCIISDYQLGWATDAAIKLGIPGAILFTGSATWSWFDLNMPHLVSRAMVPMQAPDEQLPDEDDIVVLDNPMLRRSDIPWHFWNDKGWQDFTVTWNSGTFERANWVLVNSCTELEEEIVTAMVEKIGNKFIPVGPLFLLNDEPVTAGLEIFDTGCLQWLDKQPPLSVLYVAFGSFARLPVEQRQEFVNGLEASKQRFLWTIRTSGMDTESLQFYKEFSERTKEQGLIVSWSPQVQVLSHASVGAFLTHCGWNSTVEAVSNGQPMLCWPCLFDQNLNGRLIADKWEIGTKFMKGSNNIVDRTEVERVIRMVMEEEEGRQMRLRAKNLSNVAKKAMMEDGSSRTNVKSFIQALYLKERS